MKTLTNRVLAEMKNWVHLWDKFWFAPIDPINLSAFRVIFGLNIFIFYLVRMLDFEFLFTDKGLLPFHLLASSIPINYRSPIPWENLVSTASSAFILHIVFLIGVLALAVGLVGRKTAWIVFILHLAFLKRNPVTLYGADTVATFWFLYLCLGRTNLQFRIQSLWKKTKENVKGDMFSTISVRLIQIQLCVIYAYSGLEKVRGVTWWRGDAIWNTLGNGQLVTLDLSFLHHVPLLVMFMTFTTLAWEVYFPVLVWSKKVQGFMLWFGMMLHFGIAVTLGIPFFSIFMMATYLLFIDPRVIHEFKTRYFSKWKFENRTVLTQS